MKKVAIVVTSGISIFHLSVPLAIFSDIAPDHTLYDVSICSIHGETIDALHGMHITPTSGLEMLQTADLIIIPYWPTPDFIADSILNEALQAAAKRNVLVVGLCMGAYALAYAGLLDGKKAATHWLYESDFLSRFPCVHLDTNALYVMDGNVITSAGTAAGLDCCLYIVREHYGSIIANQIARRMVIPPHREGGQAQYVQMPFPSGTRDRQIAELTETMRGNLAKQWSLEELSERAKMSRRTFTRRFKQATGVTLIEWLTTERIREAQMLLESTTHSVQRVSELVGFSSATSLREKFSAKFGVTPSSWRKTFQGKDVI
ncbi:helix-turn-helix domain-containing protein [Salmonella enterica]